LLRAKTAARAERADLAEARVRPGTRADEVIERGGASSSRCSAARRRGRSWRARSRPAMPVVGFLRSTSAPDSADLLAALRQGLQQTGFTEGQSITMEYRWADGQNDVYLRKYPRIPGIRLVAQALQRLSSWQRTGQIRFKEDILEGIERMPKALLRLLHGKNFGKQLIKIS
jgi:hypothetical protein